VPHTSSDLSDVRHVDSSQDDSETICLAHGRRSSACVVGVDRTECHTSEAVTTDVDISDLHSDQLADSDICEELVSVSHGGMSVNQTDADSQQMSDVTEQSSLIQQQQQQLSVDATRDAQISLSSNKHSDRSVFSYPDQSKLDHSMMSSTLKGISQNEDQGLVYVVFSKPISECVIIMTSLKTANDTKFSLCSFQALLLTVVGSSQTFVVNSNINTS